MAALPPIADIGGRQLDVRFVPKADITTAGTGIYLHRQKMPKRTPCSPNNQAFPAVACAVFTTAPIRPGSKAAK